MFNLFRGSLVKAQARFPSLYTYCDDDIDSSSPSLIQQADNEIEDKKSKIKTPMQFENLKGQLQQGAVHSFDGFRAAVQKNINLNTYVSHFFWIGSQNIEKPIYQYSIILPFDDKFLKVATDMDFNVEGSGSMPVNENLTIKSNFALGEQGKTLVLDADIIDKSSATQLKYTGAIGSYGSLGMSYVQSLTPSLAVGGQTDYSLDKGTITNSYGFIYDDEDNLIASNWDNNFQLLFLRRVNKNRVHLSSTLVVDENAGSTASIGAEYTLKQSKLQMSIDTNLIIKSQLTTQIVPSVNLQLSAEMSQFKEHYRFGYGIEMS